MTARGPDRRAAKRYAVTLPLFWADGKAFTRNVSEAGVFFETETALTPRECLRFSMVLGQSDPEARFVVTCEGTIVRVEVRREKIGVGVRIGTYRVSRQAVGPVPGATPDP
jgi:hypothetical protein